MNFNTLAIVPINELVRPAPYMELEARVRKRNCNAELTGNSGIPECKV